MGETGGATGRRGRRKRGALRRGRILHIRSGLSPEKTLAVRGGIVAALLITVVAVFWFDRDGLRDQIDGHISFGDVLYFAMITVTTVGYGDIVPVSQTARLIDAFAVTPIRIFIWFIFLGTAYEFVVQRIVEDFRMSRIQASMKDHVILCGYGRSGAIAADEMVARGQPLDRIVAIDQSEERIRLAAEAGLVGLRGDADSEALLGLACVDRAKAVVVTAGRDDTTILVVLTVRHLAPDTRIVASIREEENIKLARLSGADTVISPPRIGGYLMADAVGAAHAAPFLCDLMSAAGTVELHERPAAEADIGKRMAEVAGGIVVQIHSQGHDIPFSERERYIVRRGDTLLLIAGPKEG